MSDKNVIADFIGTYPDPKSDTFQYDLTRKAEFYEYRLERSEKTPEHPGELLDTQKFMSRFFSTHTPYSTGLAVHGLGTGKSCLISAIVESSKNSLVNGKKRKKALILVKNDTLRRNLINEVSKVCTAEIYKPKPTAREIKKGVEMTEKAEYRRLTRAVSENYEIRTFETFFKSLSKNPDEVKRQHSYRDIIIDEAHALRIQPPKKAAKGATKDGATSLTPKKMYDVAHWFLHIIEGCKILLTTGTPIWDQTSEIASVMNLILPMEEQLETGAKFNKAYFDEKGNLTKDAVRLFKQRFAGRVSYLRQMVTTAKRIEMGTSKPWLEHVKVYPDRMSDTQSAYADQALKKYKKAEKGDEPGGSFYIEAREAANLVLPIFNKAGELEKCVYGTEAFNKYAVKISQKVGTTGKSVKSYAISDLRIQKALRDELSEYSAKFACIIDDILAHPKEKTYVFFERVTGTGGAIMFAICAQLRGLDWIKSSTGISKASEKRRFALITSDPQTINTPAQVQKLLEISNKPENKYCDHLQTIVGSEKIAIGISIKDVRRIHIVMPHWNLSAIDQALNRGFRFGGHDALPENEREIHIFKHVSVDASTDTDDDKPIALPKGVGFPDNKNFSKRETIDTYIYNIAEKKDYANAQVYRLLKEAAFDCALFYNRNVLPEDVPGTRECDYRGSCEYQCDTWPRGKSLKDPLPDESIDYSTYNLYYSEGKIRETIKNVVELFRNYFSLRIDAIKDLLELKDGEMPILLKSLDIIIDSRIAIRNRYGFNSYLKEQNNIVFLDSSISPKTNYPESIYVENPLVTERTSMSNLIEIMELNKDKASIKKFCKDPQIDVFESYNHITKILMLETVYKKYKTNDPSDKSSLDGKAAGLRLDKISRIVLEDMGSDIYIMKDGTPVHVLYTEEFKGLSYDVTARALKPSGAMRIFDKEEDDWIYINSYEKEEKYIAQIKELMQETSDEFKDALEEHGVVGWVSKLDENFRIILDSDKGKRSKRGMVCSSFDSWELVDIYIRLGKFPPINPNYKKFDKPTLIAQIRGISKVGFDQYKEDLNEKDEKYLQGLLTLFTMDKSDICDALRITFDKIGILYRK